MPDYPDPTPQPDQPQEPPKQPVKLRTVQSDPEWFKEMRERFDRAAEAEAVNRKAQLEDQAFEASDQWDPQIKARRQADGRPCLTINRITPGVRQNLNEIRQNPPSVQVNPVDSGADPATAEVLQGLIRHVETQSQADIQYETASESQIRIGLGYLRLRTDYIDDESFNQEIYIDAIENRFTVFRDPSSLSFDASDAEYFFVIHDYATKEEYTAAWPKSSMATDDGLFSSEGAGQPAWFPGDGVRVADYYHLTYAEETLTVGDQTRTVRKPTVYVCTVNAYEELASHILPGKRIPIFPVIGERRINDKGEVDYRGVVRDAKDAQRVNNATESELAWQVGTMTKPPWILDPAGVEGFTPFWDEANRKAFAWLPYASFDAQGRPTRPPVYNSMEPPIQATVFEAQRSENNLRATMGLIDVHGNERGEQQQSGRAILARQRQAETGNVHLPDNLGRAVRAIGRCLLDWFPIVYDVPRMVRILGETGKPKAVMVYAGAQNAPGLPDTQQQAQQGLDGVFELGVGRYDVTITTGQTETRRQENINAMAQLFQQNPQIFPLYADLFFANMDTPIAKEMSERAKKIPPLNQIVAQEQGQPAIPPQVQAQVAQMQAQMQQLAQENQQLKADRQGKMLDTFSRQQIAEEDRKLKWAIANLQSITELAKANKQAVDDQHAAIFAENSENLRQLTELQHDAVSQKVSAMVAPVGQNNGNAGPTSEADTGGVSGEPAGPSV